MALSSPPSRTVDATDENFQWMDREEERRAFDEQVRALLKISGDEFLHRLDTGFYDGALDDTEQDDLMYLSMLADLAR